MLMQTRLVPSCSLGNRKALPEKRPKVWACGRRGNGAAESKNGPEPRQRAAALSVGNEVGLCREGGGGARARQKTEGGAGNGESGRKAEFRKLLEGGVEASGLGLSWAEGLAQIRNMMPNVSLEYWHVK